GPLVPAIRRHADIIARRVDPLEQTFETLLLAVRKEAVGVAHPAPDRAGSPISNTRWRLYSSPGGRTQEVSRTLHLTAPVGREGDLFWARCLEVKELVAHGASPQEAVDALAEVAGHH